MRVKLSFLPCLSSPNGAVWCITVKETKCTGKVHGILWNKEKGNKEWWFTVLSVPLWHLSTGHHWNPYTGPTEGFVDLVLWFSLLQKSSLFQKLDGSVLVLHFKELKKKKPKRFCSNVAFFNEKNGNDISPNMQLDKTFQTPFWWKLRASHFLFWAPAQELLPESQSWEWSQQTAHISPALKGSTSVIFDRHCSKLF